VRMGSSITSLRSELMTASLAVMGPLICMHMTYKLLHNLPSRMRDLCLLYTGQFLLRKWTSVPQHIRWDTDSKFPCKSET